MKTSIYALFVLLAVARVSSNVLKDWIKPAQECVNEIGMTHRDLEEKYGCNNPKKIYYTACVLKKMGVISNGKIVIEKGKHFVLKTEPDTDEETMKATIKCFTQANEQAKEFDVVKALCRCEEAAGI